MRVTMLGCGPSWGVPRIGGEWGAGQRFAPRLFGIGGQVRMQHQRPIGIFEYAAVAGVEVALAGEVFSKDHVMR